MSFMGTLRRLFFATFLCGLHHDPYLNKGPIRVGLMELNHVHNKQGQRVLSQVIYWNQYEVPGGQEWRPVGYIVLSSENAPMGYPLKIPGGWESLFAKRLDLVEGEVLIKIISARYRESWTNYDVEVDGRSRWKNGLVAPNIFDIPLPGKSYE